MRISGFCQFAIWVICIADAGASSKCKSTQETCYFSNSAYV